MNWGVNGGREWGRDEAGMRSEEWQGEKCMGKRVQ